MENDTVSFMIIVVCVAMSAYFSATETAFSSLNRIRIKNMAEKGSQKAQLVLKLSENYDSLLSTILIGNNIVNIACASLATMLFAKALGNEAGPSVSTAVTTVVVLIFGEVSPKSIAKESPEKFAMFSAPLLNIFMKLLTPINFLFRQWKKMLSLLFKSVDDSGITEEELLTFVEEVEQDGGIDEQESMLIHSALEFTEQEAIDILTPRINITAVSTEDTKEKVASVFVETAYSRIPIYKDSIDHIVGIIYHKDFYNYVYNGSKEISEIIRPTLYIPKNKKVGVLMKELQKKKLHFAVVLDEFGGTIGIITLEDILEELVGEIWDEHDEICDDIEIKSENEFVVSGFAKVDEVFELLGVDEDNTDVQSVIVNGWVMNELGQLPKKDAAFEYKGYWITVLEMVENCVGKILIKKQ